MAWTPGHASRELGHSKRAADETTSALERPPLHETPHHPSVRTVLDSRPTLRVSALGLALMMGLPWQLALWAALVTSPPSAPCHRVRLDEAPHHLQLSGRACDRVVRDGLVL